MKPRHLPVHLTDLTQCRHRTCITQATVLLTQ